MSQVVNLRESKESELIDSFYVKHGPCCAGCDWWQYANTVAGQCIRHAPVSRVDSLSASGLNFAHSPSDSGHPMTVRDHYCGDFKDDFDWSSLPLPYLRRIRKSVQV